VKGKFKFDKLIIVNAEDLAKTKFACMWDHHHNIIQMKPTYDTDKKTLTIAAIDLIEFGRFR